MQNIVDCLSQLMFLKNDLIFIVQILKYNFKNINQNVDEAKKGSVRLDDLYTNVLVSL